jgi:hypothetical protein
LLVSFTLQPLCRLEQEFRIVMGLAFLWTEAHGPSGPQPASSLAENHEAQLRGAYFRSEVVTTTDIRVVVSYVMIPCCIYPHF